ncbi:MAG TPA: hypothetical protein VF993_12550 [Myxococcales bacterium]
MRALVLLVFAGCASAVPAPRDEHLTTAAWERERYCGAGADEALPELLEKNVLDSVEPVYARVQSKSSMSKRLLGAELHPRALPGMTAEWLEPILHCHAAIRVLETGRPDDPRAPFWISGGWVQIYVRPETGGFQVDLHGESPAEAQRILERAQALLAARR